MCICLGAICQSEALSHLLNGVQLPVSGATVRGVVLGLLRLLRLPVSNATAPVKGSEFVLPSWEVLSFLLVYDDVSCILLSGFSQTMRLIFRYVLWLLICN